MGGEDWFGGLKKILLFLFCVRLRAVPWEARRGRQSPQSWSYRGGVVVVVFFGILAEYQRWVPSLLAVSLSQGLSVSHAGLALTM